MGTAEQDMLVQRVAVLAYHSDPLQEPGSGDAGGMTVYVKGLAAALSARGIATDIFTRSTSPDAAVVTIEPGVRVVPIQAGPMGPVPKEELPAHVDDFVDGIVTFAAHGASYDVIHSHYWQSGLAGRRLAERWDVPLVHSHHTLGRVKNATLAPGDAPEPDIRLAGEQEVIAGADVLIASTQEEFEALACMYRAPHDRLKILPPGVDHDRFHPGDRAAARDRLGIPADRKVILVVGRIQKLKGQELALRTLERLVGQLEEPPLMMFVGGPSGNGGESEVDRLTDLSHELGLDDLVTFSGPHPHSELPIYYAACDLVLICSHSESFGLASLEAHASGRPVIATPVGGPSQLVIDGVTGFVIEGRDPGRFAERVATLLTDDELARSFEEKALAASMPYSWDATAKTFLDLYECLISERAPELCTCP